MPKTRVALLGVLGALLTAAAGVAARRRLRADPLSPPASHPVDGSPAQPQSFTCSCGARYRTSGVGRHRVYWPADAPDDQPVLGDACPSCGEALPAEPQGAAT